MERRHHIDLAVTMALARATARLALVGVAPGLMAYVRASRDTAAELFKTAGPAAIASSDRAAPMT